MSILKSVFCPASLLLTVLACTPSAVTSTAQSPARPAVSAVTSGSGSIRGMLRVPGGRAIQDAVVSFECTDPRYFAIDTTDTDGGFNGSNLPFGSYKVEVTGWGIGGNTVRKVRIQPGMTDLNLNFTDVRVDWDKKGKATLKVIVFDQVTSKAMSEALVELSFRGTPFFQARTDYNGEVFFAGLPEDKVSLKISGGKHKDAEEKLFLVRDRDNTRSFFLAPSMTVLKIRVLDKNTEKPIPGVSIRSNVIEKVMSTSIKPTDEKGETSVSFAGSLLSSEVPLDVSLIGYGPVVQSVQVTQNQENAYTVYLSPGSAEGDLSRPDSSKIREWIPDLNRVIMDHYQPVKPDASKNGSNPLRTKKDEDKP